MTEFSDRIRRFHELHERGCFVIPNPWDRGSARLLAQLGFPALATTSAGFAWSMGHADQHVELDDVLEHLRGMCRVVDVPISADFEGGFGIAPEAIAGHVTQATTTGIAGLSIEDSSGDPAQPLFEFGLAVERISAARRAIDESGTGVLLTARTEGFIAGRPDLRETVLRLTAFADAGADCVHAPGLRTLEDIRTVVSAVAPKPVNVLVGSAFTTVAELADAGVRRISVGGALARTAWTGFLNAAHEIAKHGTFNSLGHAIPGTDLNRLLREP
jgi:2-methylisocitrate lyase-like PEP mutase family enzyme